MAFLHQLAALRTPLWDAVMAAVTHLGEEVIFLAIAVIVLWCVDKKHGYYLLVVGFLGTQINQLLKATFRIERPWVRDPSFSPVKAAIPEATGYSFPSGHTQCAIGTFGALARLYRAPWWRILCIILCVVIPFSRLYLGVHTPLDVGVSAAIAAALVFGVYPLMTMVHRHKHGMRFLGGAMILLSAAQAVYMSVTLHGHTQPELQNALNAAYKMLGATIGFAIAYELDTRFIRFETTAVWWAQLLKVVLGLSLTLGVKELCYAAFAFIPYQPLSRCLAYIAVVLFAGAVWPLTFRLLPRRTA